MPDEATLMLLSAAWPLSGRSLGPATMRTGFMEILSYSERGVINSLLYEAYYAEDRLDRLGNLLRLCQFPLAGTVPAPFNDATIIIEPKIPTFGDADAML